jgi:tRNAThr (cytosine32-N3)-methyltransferase
MAISDTTPVVQRKQLKDGMQHLNGFVTLPPSTSTSTSTPTPPTSRPPEADAEQDTYGVPSSTLSPIRKPRTEASANPEKRTDPFQFGSRYLEEGDDIFAFNAWDHVETDEAYKEFAEECYERQREAPVSEFDRSK